MGDLVIKNGTVVDGSGRPPYRGDVAIRDGKIVDPRSARPGARVIDAEGKTVAPGFVDIHTHYDAQVLWDPLCTCSPWHGVTTVVMGNCGFSLAPARPEDREFLTTMFARVEGMNVNALRKGIDWRWQSFPEYLERLEQVGLGISVASLVGHSAVRRYVMGDAASDGPADADAIQEMKAQVRSAIAAGAFGFTSSLSATHYGWDGRPVPSRLATNEEVIELGSALGEFGVGGIEIITKTAVRGQRFEEEDQQLMTTLALRSGRPVNWNELNQSLDRPGVWRTQIEFMERAAKQGAQIYAVARCQNADAMFTLRVIRSFEQWPAWKEVLSKPVPEAKRLLGDPAVRAVLKKEVDADDAAGPEWNRMGKVIFAKSKTGQFTQFENLTLDQVAQKTGRHCVDILVDCSLVEDLETEFIKVGRTNSDPAALREILRNPHSVAGISDAGAHTDKRSGSFFTTYLLANLVRGQGMLTLEEAIRRLTSMPAAVYGLHDRGLIQEGKAGDVVIMDLPELDWLPLERFNDFPGGEQRLGNRAKGYEYLIVNGDVVFHQGKDTGARPGRVLRSFNYKKNGQR